MHVPVSLIRGLTTSALALALLVPLGLSAAAEEPSARDRVEQLLPDLLSPHADAHQAARRRLLSLGEDGRNEMRRLANGEDPKVRALALEMLARQDWSDLAAPTDDTTSGPRLPPDVERLLERHLDGRTTETKRTRASTSFFGSGRMTTGDGDSFAWETTQDGGVKVTVKSAGQDEQVYEAESMEALEEAHPEIANRIGSFGVGGGLRFDFPKGSFRFELPHIDFPSIEIPHLDLTPPDGTSVWDRFGPLDEDLRRHIEQIEREWMGPRGTWDRPLFGSDGPKLGVEVRPADDVLRSQLGFDGGLVVERVVPDTLGAKLGLQRHDVLLELDGHSLHAVRDVRKALESGARLDAASATVFRKGKRVELSTER